MPYEETPPQITDENLSSEPFKFAGQSLTDAYALALVNQTFWQFETFRSQNHDRRWNTHDSLYVGFQQQKVWDGTNVARASFRNQIVFDQVESALPIINQTLFGNPEWFQVEALPGTDVQDAKKVQEAMSYIFDHPTDEIGSNALNDFKTAIKSTLLYGNGGVAVEWDASLNQPTISWVDIRDIYIDPALTTPNPDCGRAVIRRKFLTIQEIRDMKKDPRMNVPSDEILWYMSKNAPQTYAEQTKRVQEALRGVFFSPGFSDYVPLPADQQVECLIYYSGSRIIWILNKQWVLYSGPNPYGFTPFAFAPCYNYISRFYGQSIADVQEDNQRYTEALLNAHYDELTLLLHPPRVMKRNALLTPAQQKWRPGIVYTAENKDDVSLLQVGGNTVNVFDDIQYLSLTAEKRTGINGLGSGSVPQPSNANRTLGGLQMQQAGSNTRLMEIVSNIEQYLILPVLYKVYKLLQFHTRPGQPLPATGPDGNYNVDAALVQSKLRFKMLASSKMITRDKLLQIVPFFMQAFTQGPFIQELAKIGQTVDFGELFRMMQDATGVGGLYTLIRQMSPEEQQQLNQPPPQAQADMQKAQLDAQTRQQLMQMKVQGELQKAQIQKQPEPPSPWQQMLDQQKAQQEAAAQQAQLQAQQQAQAQELKSKQIMDALALHAKQQHAHIDLQKKQAELAMQVQKSATDRQQAQMGHELKMQQLMQQLAAQKAGDAISLQSAQDQAKAKAAQNEKRPKKKAETNKKPK